MPQFCQRKVIWKTHQQMKLPVSQDPHFWKPWSANQLSSNKSLQAFVTCQTHDVPLGQIEGPVWYTSYHHVPLAVGVRHSIHRPSTGKRTDGYPSDSSCACKICWSLFRRVIFTSNIAPVMYLYLRIFILYTYTNIYIYIYRERDYLNIYYIHIQYTLFI